MDLGTSPLPELVRPMLATAGPLPVASGWALELKWDGVRAVSYVSSAGVRVVSRNDLDVTGHYPELAVVKDLLAGRSAVLDGEIVALDDSGRPSFGRLQDRMHVRAPGAALLAAVPVCYHVFDVLYLDGASTLDLPYRERREVLAGLGLVDGTVRVPPHYVDVDGAHLLSVAEAAGLEGLVAKRCASVYRPGRRSPDWVKVPLNRTQEVVVVGWKAGGGRRSGSVGSLALAVPDPAGGLVFAGGVGTGFTGAMLDDLYRRMAPLHRSTPAAVVPREHRRGVHWVEPVLVGEVNFRNWTSDGRMRHPSWRGLRPDRDPASIEPREKAPAVSPAVDGRAATAVSPAAGGPGRTPPAVEVAGAMQTPDSAWRVEVVNADSTPWYRVRHAHNVIDWLTLPDVERVLAGAGIDLSDLTDAAAA